MPYTFKGWTPVPLSELRLDNLPNCSDLGHDLCIKDGGRFCRRRSIGSKGLLRDKCRRITITIEEALE